MARRRIPPAVARVTGRDQHDPGRFRGRNHPAAAPLGEAADWMADDARDCFEGFRAELPWLRESDRALVEIAASLRGRMVASPDVGLKALNALRLCLSAMGATPTDRSKITTTDDREPDPAAKFLS